MPTMYRIGCFRDDIIFFINLYQRWIYPIDKKRTNEFGTSGEPAEGENNNSQGQIEDSQSTKVNSSTTQSSDAVGADDTSNNSHLKSE
jgi:hypothetical protein